MGKGNRNRNDRYDEVYNMSGAGAAVKAPRAAAKKDRTTAILITVIAVLLLSMLALYIFSDTGIMERGTVYVSSDNYEVTGTMLPYYENLAYSNMFDQYFNLYYSYVYSGDATQAYNAVAQMMSQYPLSAFFDSAIETAKDFIALAEEAHKNGVSLDDEELASLEETVKEYKNNALGAGVKKKDVRRAVELQLLASKYAEKLSEEIEAGATEEDILAYTTAHKSEFYTIDILKYDFSLKAADFDGKNTVEYETASRLMDAYVTALEEATSPEEFKKRVIEYEVRRDFEDLMQANLGELEAPAEEMIDSAKTKLTENLYKWLVEGEDFSSSLTDDATYAEVFEKVSTKLLATCTASVTNLDKTEKYTVSADDEALKWLSGDDAVLNATKTVDASTDDTYAKSVYIVTEPMHLDESETVDVAHILIKADSKATDEEKATAKAKAEDVLAEFLAGEKTLEAFEKLAETYNEDSGCVYEGVYKGQMVKAFEEWSFDEARAEGDTGVVETEFGYHVMYFIGEGGAVYYNNAMKGFVDDEYVERVEALVEAHVTTNDKAISKKTSITEAEPAETTTAPAETTAAPAETTGEAAA